MKKQVTKNLTILLLVLAVLAGAFSCVFFTNDVAYATELPSAVSGQWFDGNEYNNRESTLDAINKLIKPLKPTEKEDFKKNPVVVAVIDTGINPSHELFRDVLCDESLWYCSINNNSFDKKRGRDYVIDKCDNGKLIGHGTHVAGIVAQEIKKYGLEDYVKILPVKASEQGSFSPGNVAQAINYVTSLAKTGKTIVINMSLTRMINSMKDRQWGAESSLNTAVQNAVKEGIIVCAAAGNDGLSSSGTGYCLGSPACLEKVIGVMNYGDDGKLYYKSNYGDAYDIVAPGVNILSASKDGENNYNEKNGTSMATPFVSFSAAVLQIGFNRKSANVYEVLTETPIEATGNISHNKGFYTAKKLNLSALIGFNPVKEIKVEVDDEYKNALVQSITSPQKVVFRTTLRYVDQTEIAPPDAVAYKYVKMYVVKVGADGNSEVVTSVNSPTLEFTPTEPGNYMIYAKRGAYVADTSEGVKLKVNYAENIADANLSIEGDTSIRAESSVTYQVNNAYMIDPGTAFLWSIYDENGKLIDTKNGSEFTFTPTKKGTYKIVATVGGQKISEFSVVVKTSEKTVREVSGGVTSALAISAVVAVLIVVVVKMLKRRA